AVKRDEPAFAITGYADRHGSPPLIACCEPIHGGEDLLHFVADDMAANLVRHSIDPFTVRLVRHANARDAGPRIRAVDEHRHEHLATVLSQAARELRTCIYSGDDAHQRLGG